MNPCPSANLPGATESSPETAFVPLTQMAQDQIKRQLQPGQTAIDATTGNGHDTVFLATLVGSSGMVFGFDIQEQALTHTRQRLVAAGLEKRVTLIQDGHENMLSHIPPRARGNISAVMFNLGYLPNSDKHTITRPDTTLAAIESAARILAAGGVMTIQVYRGHAGGQAEGEAIERLLGSMDKEQFRIVLHASAGPRLYVVRKLTQTRS